MVIADVCTELICAVVVIAAGAELCRSSSVGDNNENTNLSNNEKNNK